MSEVDREHLDEPAFVIKYHLHLRCYAEPIQDVLTWSRQKKDSLNTKVLLMLSRFVDQSKHRHLPFRSNRAAPVFSCRRTRPTGW